MYQIGVDEFLQLAKQFPVFDVRSPGEYGHGHIPGAYDMPLFTDEERKIVGTAYKQQGREQAIKIGLDYFGVKMRRMVEDVERIVHEFRPIILIEKKGAEKIVLIHCWRGGMRSSGVAWLLDLYGFKVYILSGGYKAFRNWVLVQFERKYQLKVLGGYTGSGKTQLLKELEKDNYAIIDLEGLARHKGSAFGGIGMMRQPTQEMFENELGIALDAAKTEREIWIEDESQRIGTVNVPGAFYKAMQRAPVYFLEVPFEQRLNYITEEYGSLGKDDLTAAITRIQKRLGGLNAKTAISYLLEDNYKEGFRILLSYYDKHYRRGLTEREHEGLLSAIPCEQADAISNSKKLKKITPDGISNREN